MLTRLDCAQRENHHFPRVTANEASPQVFDEVVIADVRPRIPKWYRAGGQIGEFNVDVITYRGIALAPTGRKEGGYCWWVVGLDVGEYFGGKSS